MERLAALLADLEEDAVLEMVRSELANGTEPLSILRACQNGMTVVGDRFENSEYFVSDLMMSGEIFKQVGELLDPVLKSESRVDGGAVVIGTVQGDIHDIGKDIVVNMLKSANLDVTDLGVDVPPAQFVEALRETGATVLGVSGLLTLAFDSMKDTVAAVNDAGLRDTVRIMIGGGPVDAGVCDFVGADDWGADAQAAVRLAKTWLEGDVQA
ncbi:MAG: cobalamin-binding protein [Actinomycetia bacterium]|nr:cobalamin-binding protein [Actinomycetes bacterium]MCP5033908.1 cobalamin-binding protein [Actinomycetes bacterium]